MVNVNLTLYVFNKYRVKFGYPRGEYLALTLKKNYDFATSILSNCLLSSLKKEYIF